MGVTVEPQVTETNAVDYTVPYPDFSTTYERSENIVTTGTISNMNAKNKKKSRKGHILGYHMRQK